MSSHQIGNSMRTVALIGYGAMASFVANHLRRSPWQISYCVIRKGRQKEARFAIGDEPTLVCGVDEFDTLPDLVVDCAGHLGLRAHGAAVLRKGIPLVSASLGALADTQTHRMLDEAAQEGQTQLQLASGAIGALDALSAARVGGLEHVRYTGVKPPESWHGTLAEEILDLGSLVEPVTHFNGSARDAALRYPKNANVAAAVAMAGLGFDQTQTRLIADPKAPGNTHTISAKGAFGTFEFTITGNSLPDTPRTSALAAMSVVDRILRNNASIII
ncbi:aspartate dehydrogenase [Sulfitobacter sp.]|uniref:aspartate dehydrogenase n=1 Tax=Sulfitobacter sp. TaxID=1903071 RepID=UPI003FCEBF40